MISSRALVQTEEFQIELGGVSFNPIALMREMSTPLAIKSITPKVNFLSSTKDQTLLVLKATTMQSLRTGLVNIYI